MNNKRKKCYVDIRNARSPEQIAVMKKIIAAGVDPFAFENLRTYSKFKILKETTHWTFVKNEWPYRGPNKKHPVRVHIFAISKKYHEKPWTLNGIELNDLFYLFEQIAKEYKVKGGALCMRFGDTLRGGSTVKHLHVHLIEPDVNNKNYEPVSFWIGGTKTKRK